MAGFNAAEVVEALDFDFTSFDGPKGTIPEPSSKQVKKFFNTVRDISIVIRRGQKDFNEEEIIEDADHAATVLAALDETSEEHNTKMYNNVVMVCSNAFTREQLEALPFRVQNAFITWLTNQISPEAEAPATN